MSHPSTDSLLVQLLGKRLSSATLFFHAAVADRLGMGLTDAKCHGILTEHGAMSAGDLAERAGLTTGAATGVIDRLESARLARRVDDIADRRRVVVEPVANPTYNRQRERLFEPMSQKIVELASRLTAKERTTVLDFLTSASEALEEETNHLRRGR